MIRLSTATVIQAPIERCFDLARSVEVHLKRNLHYGEQAVAEAGVTSGLVGYGERVTWRARHFGIRQRLTSEITGFERPVYFQDTMRKGAFRAMQHDHYFRQISPTETEMTDEFRFSAPLAVLGRAAEILVLRRYMLALLNERNAVLKEVAESEDWPAFLKREAS
jgi:ligand-binding SRPBCC domain-containing protein